MLGVATEEFKSQFCFGVTRGVSSFCWVFCFKWSFGSSRVLVLQLESCVSCLGKSLFPWNAGFFSLAYRLIVLFYFLLIKLIDGETRKATECVR